MKQNVINVFTDMTVMLLCVFVIPINWMQGISEGEKLRLAEQLCHEATSDIAVHGKLIEEKYLNTVRRIKAVNEGYSVCFELIGMDYEPVNRDGSVEGDLIAFEKYIGSTDIAELLDTEKEIIADEQWMISVSVSDRDGRKICGSSEVIRGMGE